MSLSKLALTPLFMIVLLHAAAFSETPLVGASNVTPPVVVAEPSVAPAAVVTPPLSAKAYLSFSCEKTGARSKYQTNECKILNQQGQHLQILQADVLNGFEEGQVAQEEAESSQKKKRLFGGLLKAASVLPFATGAGYGSMGAYRAASVVSNVAQVAGNTTIDSANNTTVHMTNQYLKRFNDVYVNPNQTFQFLALTKPLAAPQLRLTFKVLETNQILDAEY